MRKLLATLLLLSSYAIVVSGQSPGSHIKTGNQFFAQEQYEKALNEYRKVPSSAGVSYSQALYNIGVCYFELWQTDAAISYYRLAIKSRPEGYPKAAYALGIALESQDKLTEARLAYRQALVRDEGATLFRLGVIAAKENDSNAAIEFFQQALKTSGPHTSSAHNNLGVMLAQGGLIVDAERHFEEAVKQTDGAFAEAVHNLNLCRSRRISAGTQRVVETTWKLKPTTR